MPSTAPGTSGEDPLAAPRRGLPGAPDFRVDGGEGSPLAQRGHSRDGKKGKLQIEFGLLCDRDGCRCGCSPATPGHGVLTDRHAAGAVLLCEGGGGPRPARRSSLRASALRGIRSLVEAGDDVALRRERPGGDHQRCVSRRTPLPQPVAGRGPGPRDLLEATEARTDCRSDATSAGKIGERKVIGRMAKHFTWSIDDDGVFTYGRDEAAIAAEAPLRGPPAAERARRSRHGARLQAAELRGTSLPQPQGPQGPRPVYPSPGPTSSCACSPTTWHMRQKLKPLLFDDEDAGGGRPSWRRQRSRRAPGPRRQPGERPGWHSFRTLIDDLATITRNTVAPRLAGAEPFQVTTRPTPLQRRAFQAPGREAIVYRDR